MILIQSYVLLGPSHRGCTYQLLWRLFCVEKDQSVASDPVVPDQGWIPSSLRCSNDNAQKSAAFAGKPHTPPSS
jgi:hypothetical protein